MPEGRGRNRRRLYRVDLAGDAAPEVEITAGGQTCRGRVVDLSFEGFGALLARGSTGPLQLGTSADVALELSGMERSIRTTATVRSRASHGRDWRYGFQFDDEEDLRPQLERGAFAIFNRRSARRVEPDADDPIQVVVRVDAPGRDSRVPAVLKDISVTGLAVLVPIRRNAAVLTEAGAVRVSLLLPPRETALALAARIRQSRVVDDGICYGLEFDPERTENLQAQQEHILEFVEQRERELRDSQPPHEGLGQRAGRPRRG